MKTLLYIFSGILLLPALSSCKKEKLLTDFNNLGIGAYLTTKTTGDNKNDTLDYNDFNNGVAKLKVGSYGSPVASVNIYAVQGASIDKTTWTLVKNVPFSDGVELSVSGAELTTAFGINASDIFSDITLYNEAVTTDGRSFSIANMDPDFEAQPSYNMAMVWPVKVINIPCEFDQSFFNGKFAVIKDEWADYEPGDLISVFPGPSATQITLTLYPNPAFGSNRKNIIVDIDPATNNATVAKQVYGDYPGAPNLSVEGSGTVSACSGIIDLFLEHSDDTGSYGTYEVILKK